MANTTKFDSFFSATCIDNNGIAVTDLNKGLMNLFTSFNESTIEINYDQNYLVSNHEQDYPELVAKNSRLGSTEYWWWILFLNGIEDPFTQFKENWVYQIAQQDSIDGFIEDSNNNNNQGAQDETRIGSVIELN